ncbi:MAG: hypothetical protein IJ830_06015 [Alphaproteobacteria bacterium]|nr:hypothetical protein [Alphaproteobacteria bacterium]
MKKIVFVLGLMMGFEAVATEAPEKFQNPIFNDMLYSAGNKSMSHDIKVTPTSITDYDHKYSNEICKYVTENETAVLLKCKEADSNEPKYDTYRMFYIRYRSDFRKVGDGVYCHVWVCPFFWLEKEKKWEGFSLRPSLHLSKIDNCADEEDYWQNDTDMNCLEEFKARGWDKYISGGLE